MPACWHASVLSKVIRGYENVIRDYSKEYYHLRNFEDLAYDAVYLLYQAQDVDREHDNHGHEFTYARSSLLNTLLVMGSDLLSLHFKMFP